MITVNDYALGLQSGITSRISANQPQSDVIIPRVITIHGARILANDILDRLARQSDIFELEFDAEFQTQHGIESL